MNIVSLFSGCGGLDLGFSQAGFDVVWANEYDKTIHDTYLFNHSQTVLDKRDIRKISSSEIPGTSTSGDACDGIIGGPPCTSWSSAGTRKGIEHPSGQLFHEYTRVVKDKQPKFFLAENVRGILDTKNKEAFNNILSEFDSIGYNVSYKLLNANDYGVPQDRWRVIIVGIRKDLDVVYQFPEPHNPGLTLRDAIYDLKDETPSLMMSIKDTSHKTIPNHDYIVANYSSRFLSSNRVRGWDEPSYTIMATHGGSISLHPQSNKMILVTGRSAEQPTRVFAFDPDSLLYRRLSVRECARIQTFPDDFIFLYQKRRLEGVNVRNGYKMVGNSVPVNFARCLAESIMEVFNKKDTP